MILYCREHVYVHLQFLCNGSTQEKKITEVLFFTSIFLNLTNFNSEIRGWQAK